MNKINRAILLFFVLLTFSLTFATSQEASGIKGLEGLWKNSHELLDFSDSHSPVAALFYGWYYDYMDLGGNSPSPANTDDPRALTPGGKGAGAKNAATSGRAQGIEYSFLEIGREEDSLWGELKITRGKEIESVPILIIDGKMYLDFARVCGAYLKRLGTSYRIMHCPIYKREDLYCFYLAPDAIYSIRYWLCDNSAVREDKVTFEDESEGVSYTVDKFISSGGMSYRATSGREGVIRNVYLTALPFTTYNKSHSMVAFGEPYLVKTDETLKSLIANSPRHTVAPLVFPLEDKPISIQPFTPEDDRIKYRELP